LQHRALFLQSITTGITYLCPQQDSRRVCRTSQGATLHSRHSLSTPNHLPGPRRKSHGGPACHTVHTFRPVPSSSSQEPVKGRDLILGLLVMPFLARGLGTLHTPRGTCYLPRSPCTRTATKRHNLVSYTSQTCLDWQCIRRDSPRLRATRRPCFNAQRTKPRGKPRKHCREHAEVSPTVRVPHAVPGRNELAS